MISRRPNEWKNVDLPEGQINRENGGRQKNRVKTCKTLLLNWSQNRGSLPPPFVPPCQTTLHAWPAFWNTVLVVLNMTIFTTFSQTRTIGHCVRFVLTISHIGVNCAKYAAYWYRNMFSFPLCFVWHFKGIERPFPILLNRKDKHAYGNYESFVL